MKKGLLLFLMVLSSSLFSMAPAGSRALQLGKSAVAPLRRSFTSFKPTQSTQLGRTFMSNMSKSYKPTSLSLIGGRTLGRLSPQTGMSAHSIQRSVAPSWQSGNQSFNAKYLIPLAAVLGLTVAPKGSVLGEEYTVQEAAQLIGFNSIDDLADKNKILAFLDKNDYQENAALFSIIVAKNLNKVITGLEDALEDLKKNKSESNLEKIRFLNKVILQVNDRNKIALAQTELKPVKDALESLLIVESKQADGTMYKGKVGNIKQIKVNSRLAHIIEELHKDAQLRGHVLDALSRNTAYAWGYNGGLIDVEKQFRDAYDSFNQLPAAYKDFAEMMLQDQGTYDKIKGYQTYLPNLFRALEELEKSYKH